MDKTKTIEFSNITTLTSSTDQFDSLTITNININKDFTPQELSSLTSHITNGGKLHLTFTDNITEDIYKKISRSMKFAGLLNITLCSPNTITSKTKTWVSSNESNQWKAINPKTADKQQGQGVTIDSLIDPFDSYQQMAKHSDCLTRPKPCKNCTCGRAQAEQQQQKGEKVDLSNFTGGCGRCYLGDAFRCANCPYRGTPAFKPGDKVDLTSNAQINENKINTNNNEVENANVVIEGNKVKLDI